MEYEVDGVRWFDRQQGHEGITALCNRKNLWCISVASAIKRIQKGDTFYVVDIATGDKVEVKVFAQPGQTPYCRTQIGKKWCDHLLALHVVTDIDVID